MRTQARAALLNGLWEQKLGVSLSSIERAYQNNADIYHPSDYESGDYEGQSFKFDWQHNLYLTEANTLTLGLESEKEQMKSDYLSQSAWGTYPSTFDNKAAHTAGYYVQDQIRLWDDWLTTLGLRLDDHSRFGTKSTYRLTSSYRIKASATRLKGSYGTGFKTPSLFQLYDLTYGNLNLRPETSTGWDLGCEQQLGPKWLTLELTYFRNYFKKMIDYDSATHKYLNRGAAETKGIEAALKARPIDDLSLTAGYTCSRTEDKTTRDKLLRRPHDKAFVNVDYRFIEKASVNLGMVAVGKRDDAYWDATSFSTKRVKLNNYNLVNLAVSYEVTEDLLLTGRIENLTDAHYEEVYGYGVNGRSAYAGLRLNF
ncbi:MAG: Vitamin B12 transporter BtuB precursor [Deltaproteobacteria bacterium ADurb.Bin510]|nr:MAG: Vitamin B12 transporter BtuB precursor [Deltaproteobacteria bacterium ADurb.Bin510]